MFIMIIFLLMLFLPVYAEPDHISDLDKDEEKAFSAVDAVFLDCVGTYKKDDARNHDN